MARLTFPDPKDPQADLIYQVTWVGWFGDDPVNPAETTIEASGCTLHDPTITADGATFWLSGGTNYTAAEIVITAVSAGGQTDQRTITLMITDR